MAASISLSHLPVIDRVGRYPLVNPVFEFAYQNPTSCLHLYEYSGRVRIGGEEYAFQKGDITCIGAGTVYSFASDKPGTHWCIHFTDPPRPEEESIELPGFLSLGGRSIFCREQLQQIGRLWIRSRHSRQSTLLQAEAQHRLKALLISLENIHASPKARRSLGSDAAWDDFLQWIDENLHEWLPNQSLAERMRLSPSAFSRKFRKIQGVPLSRYLLARRIDKAKVLLATTGLSVSEAGSSVGIGDPQYFNKQFRKVTGTSPSVFRQENPTYLTNSSGMIAAKDGHWKTK